MSHSILSVDEVGTTTIELSGMLKSAEITVTGVRSEIEALNVLHETGSNINAIIWTINDVKAEEFQAIKGISKNECFSGIPIMVISEFTDRKHIIKAIECGAVEYIAKPYDYDTVAGKVRKVLGIKYEKPESNVFEDDIVIYNFTEMFNREIKAASRGGYPLAVLALRLCDKTTDVNEQVDKADITDTLHKVLKTRLRETDTAFHYEDGGIMILLPFTDYQGVQAVIGKIGELYNTHTLIKHKNRNFRLIMESVSFPEDGKVMEKLLEKLKANIR